MSDGPWRNPCPVCGARQPPCKPECGFKPSDEDIELPPLEYTDADRAYDRQAFALDYGLREETS